MLDTDSKQPGRYRGIIKTCLKVPWKLTRWGFNRLNKTILLLAWSFIIFCLAVLGSYSYYVYIDLYLHPQEGPDAESFIRFEPPITQTIRDANGRVIIELAKESQYRKILTYEEMPQVLKDAILSAEDERFFTKYHYGIDYKSIARAAGINLGCSLLNSIVEKKLVICRSQGASTITQQSVRLWFLPEITQLEKKDSLITDNLLSRTATKLVSVHTVNSFTRKLMEARLSVWITGVMAERYGSRLEGQKQIFSRFANYTYFGNGRYGVESACEYYFQISCKELTEKDADKAALIAGIIKSPALYAPRVNQSQRMREKQIERRNSILNLMSDNKFIPVADKEMLVNKSLDVLPYQNKTIAPSVVDDILKEARRNGFSTDDIFQGSIQIQSTVDLRIQQIANNALEEGLMKYEERHPQYKGEVQGSVVIVRNNDAAILGEVGGREWYQGRKYRYSDLNRINRLRQEGSSFKPFVYLTAYINGVKPDDIIDDSPFSVSMGYRRGRHPIHNYDGKYVGKAPIESMLYRSRNVPTVKLALSLGDGEESGMDKIAKTIKLLGIETPLHNDIDHHNKRIYYITSALGASEMTLMELTNAYRAIASGIYAKPYMIKRINNRNGSEIHSNKPSPNLVAINEEFLEMIRKSMRKVITQPGGTAYSLTEENFPVPVMGKTGTTDDFRNALFIGSTYGPNGITVGVRINFDDNRELGNSETGALTALPVFKKIMQEVYETGLVGPIPNFPEDIQSVQ